LEWYACQPQNLAAHVTSVVTEGVFVRYPQLRFVLLDGGAAWLAPFLWRLDKNFKGLRSEVPWLSELPSAYVLRHFRLGTRGLEQAENAEHLWGYLRDIQPERTLLYASGYPSWDMQEPGEVQVMQRVSHAVRERIAGENAREFYGLEKRV
jgi:predicted TIM-barrel fold metal-dependent hydrolase